MPRQQRQMPFHIIDHNLQFVSIIGIILIDVHYVVCLMPNVTHSSSAHTHIPPHTRTHTHKHPSMYIIFVLLRLPSKSHNLTKEKFHQFGKMYRAVNSFLYECDNISHLFDIFIIYLCILRSSNKFIILFKVLKYYIMNG